MKNIIFIAPPAAGKGTLSQYLIDNYGYKHISTGDIIRKMAKKDKSIQAKLESGELFDDEFIFEILDTKLNKLKESNHYIFDGVPRTIKQVEFLEEHLKDVGYIVCELKVDKEVLERRITGRRVCLGCGRNYNINNDNLKPKNDNRCDYCDEELIRRDDDNEISFKRRYRNYLNITKPIVDYYKKIGKYTSLDNNQGVEKSINELLKEVQLS